MVASTTFEGWLHDLAKARSWQDRARLRQLLTRDILDRLQALDNESIDELLTDLFNHPYHSFEPRADNQSLGDEQTGFLESQSLITVGVGGNGSGKTYIGAQRAVKFLCEDQPPPARDTPFWIIANTFDQVCQSTWEQKLLNIMPRDWVQWDRITWYREKRNWPLAVPLKPWPSHPDRNWVLEFKSYEQGREQMQAASIGGAWFTEQFPYDVFTEVLRGIREHAFPGSVWCEFTPIDPEKSVPMQDMYEKWLASEPETKSWNFFHLNTQAALNAGHVKGEWFDTFFGGVSDEMRETRMAGAFASYEGAIYKSFRPRVHLVDSMQPPPGAIHKRSIDWGASEEHPLVCLWGYKDALGAWWIYDEYWNNSQSTTWEEHAEAIKSRHTWPNNPHYRNTYGDPSRPDLLREFGRLGIPITSARNAVYEGIECVREHLKIDERMEQPRLFIHKERCPYLARQMKTYRWERSSGMGVNPKAARPVPLKNDDDSADALRYLLFSDYIGQGTKVISSKIRKPIPKSIQFKRRAR